MKCVDCKKEFQNVLVDQDKCVECILKEIFETRRTERKLTFYTQAASEMFDKAMKEEAKKFGIIK